LEELLYQALETEQGGVKIYENAVRGQNDDLKKEWGEYLEQTRNHEVVMLRVLDGFGLDPSVETPGRQIIRNKARNRRVSCLRQDVPNARGTEQASPRRG
jgi:rubrerythrin